MTVRKDMRLQRPIVETPTHSITKVFDPDLYNAFEIAFHDMIDFITNRWNL